MAYIYLGLRLKESAMFKGCLLLLCLVGAQAAEIYSWRDKEGVMHFGEKPPENALELKKKIIADAPPSESAGERDHINDSQRLLRAFDEERAERNQQKSQQKIEQQKREKQCQQARKNVEIFESTSGRFVTEKDGSQRALSPVEDRAYGERLREMVAKFCDA